ncbi:hypothetical protein [Mycobacterium sp.]|uniref:hypothetical protein n=1 Tax=Mycobacterium sp. TaxID=1785 RepID=UPI003A88E714
MGPTFFDVAAVCSVADRIAEAAESVNDVAVNHLSQLTFGGAHAGSAYVDRGEALRAGLDRLSADVSRWSGAAAENAAVLRSGAARYAAADFDAAARIA